MMEVTRRYGHTVYTISVFGHLTLRFRSSAMRFSSLFFLIDGFIAVITLIILGFRFEPRFI